MVDVLQSVERLLLGESTILVPLIPTRATSVASRRTIRVQTRLVGGLVSLALLHFLFFLYCRLLKSEGSLRLVTSTGASGCTILSLLLLR